MCRFLAIVLSDGGECFIAFAHSVIRVVRTPTVQIRWHKRMALSGYHLLPGEAACVPCDVQWCAAGWDSTEIFLCVPALVCSTSTVCCRVTIYAII